MDNLKNREMIYHENLLYRVSMKLEILPDLLHELIRNNTRC